MNKNISPSTFHKLSALLIACLSGLTVMAMPFIFSAIIQKLAIDEAHATLATSLEIAMIALGSIFVSLVLVKINPRLTAIVGLVAYTAGQFLSLSSDTITLMLIARGLSGIGQGLCMGVGFSFLAQAEGGKKLLSYSAGLMSALGLLSFSLVPILNEYAGPDAIFWTLVSVGILCLPLGLSIPSKKLSDEKSVDMPPQKALSLDTLFLFLMSALFSAGSNTLWLYLDPIGASVNLTLVQIGQIGSLGLIAGMLSPFFTNAAYRFSVSPIYLCLICLITGVTSYLNATTASSTVYIASIIVMGFTYSSFLSYIRMYSAHIDGSGRATAATSGADSLGMVVGPLVAAATLNLANSYHELGVFASLSQMFALSMGLLVAVSMWRARGKKARLAAV
nr:MFS transporter [Pseudomonas sp. BJa5]